VAERPPHPDRAAPLTPTRPRTFRHPYQVPLKWARGLSAPPRVVAVEYPRRWRIARAAGGSDGEKVTVTGVGDAGTARHHIGSLDAP